MARWWNAPFGTDVVPSVCTRLQRVEDSRRTQQKRLRKREREKIPFHETYCLYSHYYVLSFRRQHESTAMHSWSIRTGSRGIERNASYWETIGLGQNKRIKRENENESHSVIHKCNEICSRQLFCCSLRVHYKSSTIEEDGNVCWSIEREAPDRNYNKKMEFHRNVAIFTTQFQRHISCISRTYMPMPTYSNMFMLPMWSQKTKCVRSAFAMPFPFQ